LTIRLISRLLFAAYFIEAGLVLTVVPWSGFWDRNYFADVIPLVGALVRTSAFRGAVTGVGLITTLAGVVELAGLFAGVRAAAAERGEQGP
jgi:polyferredoxin